MYFDEVESKNTGKIMQETARAIQELIITLQTYWYFSFVYIWWIATTILFFKEKKLESWKQKEVPFNWIVYLIVLGALLALFYGNRVAFNTLFEGGIKILIVILIFLKDLIVCIFQLLSSILLLILSSINFSSIPFKITVILLIIITIKYRHSILDKLSKILPIILGIIQMIVGVIILGGIGIFWFLVLGLIIGVSMGFMELLQINLDSRGWFSWFDFEYLIPLIALIFYPATNFTLNFLVESFTRHPLEGALTVKTSRRTWLFIIGLLILLTGIIGKILR